MDSKETTKRSFYSFSVLQFNFFVGGGGAGGGEGDFNEYFRISTLLLNINTGSP